MRALIDASFFLFGIRLFGCFHSVESLSLCLVGLWGIAQLLSRYTSYQPTWCRWLGSGLVVVALQCYVLHAHPIAMRDFYRSQTVVGQVVNIPTRTVHATHFLFKWQDRTLKLAWYHHAPPIHVGERWQLSIKLKPIRNLRNPGSFDYVRWAFINGIAAQGYVQTNPQNHRINQPSPYSLQQWRAYLYNKISHLEISRYWRAFFSALLLGVRNDLHPNDWQVWRQTGTSHLLAISGLHISLFFLLLVYPLRRWIMRYSPFYISIPYQAEAVALLLTWGYALLAGFSLPTQRACFGLSFALGIRWRDALQPFSVLIAHTLIAVLVIHPLSAYQASFYLSFGAVMIVVMVNRGINRRWAFWRRMLSRDLGVFIGLIPITAYFFKQIAWCAPLANMIAIPWTSFVILPMALCGLFSFILSPSLALLFFQAASYCGQGLVYVLGVLSTIPHNILNTQAFTLWVSGLYLLVGFVSYLPIGNLLRSGLFLLVLMSLKRPLIVPLPGTFYLTTLDVGQGLAMVVRTRHHILVYDTGDRFLSGFSMGQAVVVPYLRMQGIDKLDTIIISHHDKDHRGGFSAVYKNYPANVLSSSPVFLRKQRGLYCHAGQHWVWDGVLFKILWPLKGSPYQGNNSSCVLQIIGQQQSALLTGDIEHSTETQLVGRYGTQLRSQILIAPHHGSRTSSSLDFLQVVAPQSIIISSGEHNRYHLPARSIVQRYHQLGIKVLNTRQIGAIRYDHQRVYGLCSPQPYDTFNVTKLSWLLPSQSC